MNPRLPDDDDTHRVFAWDGFSFRVPSDWDLSFYDFSGGSSSVRMEDEAAIRLELEWCRPTRAPEWRRVQERHRRVSSEIEARAESSRTLEGLPSGWAAVSYVMAEQRVLVMGMWLSPGGRFFCFVRLHFDRPGAVVERTMRDIAASFTLHDEGRCVPWALYDLSFELPRTFRLGSTALEAGRKLFVFDWRLRRLFVWQFSLADLLLKGRPPSEWAAGFLNGFAGIRGPTFSADAQGAVTARHKRHPLGHYEELARLCFRYRVACRHDREQNTLRLAVYHYRQESDLAMLAGTWFTADSADVGPSPA